MFKLSSDRRTHRLDRAKSELARAGGKKGIESFEQGGAAKKATAIAPAPGEARRWRQASRYHPRSTYGSGLRSDSHLAC
jgi:hypothetical protein